MTQTSQKLTTLKTGEINFEKYQTLAQEAVSDVQARAEKQGQFLNWINFLPNHQLKNIDNLFDLAQKARAGKYTDIAVLGIGGSRHTTESLITMLNLNKHAHFYSSVDPTSFERFSQTLYLDKTQVLEVTKSGGKLEKKVA